jgi:hypothetical protein
MDEYIKRETAFNAIIDLAGKAPTRSAYEAVWKSARALKKIPAADVAPVVHGRWVSVAGKRDRICSRCLHNEPYKNADDDAEVFEFCPHCGAKMDGGNS